MFNKNWWFLNFQKEFLNFSFCIRKLAVALYIINEIQPKIKFQNIVQCPFKQLCVKSWNFSFDESIQRLTFHTMCVFFFFFFFCYVYLAHHLSSTHFKGKSSPKHMRTHTHYTAKLLFHQSLHCTVTTWWLPDDDVLTVTTLSLCSLGHLAGGWR